MATTIPDRGGDDFISGLSAWNHLREVNIGNGEVNPIFGPRCLTESVQSSSFQLLSPKGPNKGDTIH